MIKLSGIEKIYSTSQATITALHDIHLDVKSGEIFGVIGKSGAGKSTLIRCINLLEKPNKGRVFVDGEELTALSENALRAARRKIGMIFQHFNLLSSKTVFENVALPLKFMGLSDDEIKKQVLSLLDLTHIKDKQHQYPKQLSGGQKQRVAIARALASSPKVLLCDEATSCLDPQTTQTILHLLKEINQRLGLTIFLITHEMDVVKQICDRIALLEQGKLVEETELLQFLTNPKTAQGKVFVHELMRQELSSLIKNRLFSRPEPHSLPIVKIVFHGVAAAEPIIFHLIQTIGLEINILQAQIELIKNETIGTMVIEINSQPSGLEAGLAYLKNKGLQVEVIGYVKHALV
jgi:D-methionine transport system ATP-binding protein